MTMQNVKPWDARLANRLIYTIRDSDISPNHLTTLRLMTGFLAFSAFALGNYFWSNIGALFFVTSNFLDHVDGEYARLTGKTSRFGHFYDLASDALVNIFLFIGIGIGLMHSNLENFALPMGIIAGLSVAAIFHMRLSIENHIGKDKARQPNLGIIEAEDVLYLIPVISLTEQLVPFLILASIGAPLFALWVLKEFLAMKNES